ncbi:MAG: hypothetical protein WC791_02235 [Candidatus Paceibacterota bacterium]|jgi:hypothetical protein
MIWQDWVFGIGTIIFAIALLPSVLGKDKPAVSTSVTTGAILILYSFTQASLSLWFASIASVVAGALWFILAVQKYRIK